LLLRVKSPHQSSRQIGGRDCGVFVMANMLKEIFDPQFIFTQSDVAALRANFTLLFLGRFSLIDDDHISLVPTADHRSSNPGLLQTISNNNTEDDKPSLLSSPISTHETRRPQESSPLPQPSTTENVDGNSTFSTSNTLLSTPTSNLRQSTFQPTIGNKHYNLTADIPFAFPLTELSTTSGSMPDTSPTSAAAKSLLELQVGDDPSVQGDKTVRAKQNSLVHFRREVTMITFDDHEALPEMGSGSNNIPDESCYARLRLATRQVSRLQIPVMTSVSCRSRYRTFPSQQIPLKEWYTWHTKFVLEQSISSWLRG
jgi:hypothetical protein